MAHASAPPRWPSAVRRHSTRACDAPTPCRAGCGRVMPYKKALHRREASVLRCKAMLRRASRGLKRAAGLVLLALASAPLRWLSVGRRRSTRACHTSTPCRTGCGWYMSYGRALQRREAFLPPCKPVLQRASGGAVASSEQPAFAVHASAPPRWLSVARRRSMRACDARAPCRAGCGRYIFYERALLRRKASLARCKTVLQRASRGLQRAAGFCGARKRATALAVCGEETQHARLRRARAVPRWLWLVHVLCKGTAPARSIFLSVQDYAPTCQPWPPMSSRLWRRTQARHCVGCLWGGGAARSLAKRARRDVLVVLSPCPKKEHCTGVKPFSLGARPCLNVLATAFNERPPFAWRTQAFHCVGCPWGAGAARALATRVRRAARDVVGTCPM